MPKRSFRLRPYAGLRFSSRGVRPYMGVGCVVPFLAFVVFVALVAQL